MTWQQDGRGQESQGAGEVMASTSPAAQRASVQWEVSQAVCVCVCVRSSPGCSRRADN